MEQVVGGAIHTVTENEKNAFTDHVNNSLKEDPDLKNILPIDPKNIFNAVQDGIILCKMINLAVKNTIPAIAINVHQPLSIFHKIQNLNLAISSSKSIGCTVVNVTPQLLLEKKEHIIMGLIWQIIRIHIFKSINLKTVPQIIVLKKQDQELQAIFKLKPEDLLIRWLNYHIAQNGQKRIIKNLGKDLSDGEAYGHVFSHISQQFNKEYWTLNPAQRAAKILKYCQKLNIKPYIRAQDIVNGHQKLNILFCTQIFNQHHGLKLKQDFVFPEITQPAETDQSRQIKVFKNWINSMGLEQVYVNYLIADLKDGRILLKVIERLRPGLVNWKKYSPKLQNRINRVQNCNYAIELCKNDLKIKIIAVGGIDIVDGKSTLVLGIVWQLCRLYWIQRTGDFTDDKLLEWSNSRVPQNYRIKSFKDKSIVDCMFLLKIIESIQPRVIDYKLVKTDNSHESIESNIRYTIASARRIGAEVMLLWEHIFECNSKFIVTFVSQLHHLSLNYKK